jgi:hypothetical protein
MGDLDDSGPYRPKKEPAAVNFDVFKAMKVDPLKFYKVCNPVSWFFGSVPMFNLFNRSHFAE